MAILKGLLSLILTLAIMAGAIVGSYMIAQDNPFDTSHKHDLMLVEATEPTCDEAGARQHYVCNGCDKIFADETGYVVLTAEEISLSPLGHIWVKTEDGSGEKCEYCEKVNK